MKSNKLKITTSIIAFLLCVNVYAQRQGGRQSGDRQGMKQRGGQPDAEMILKKLDTNNDGVIDKEEAANDERKGISDRFDEIDTNEDSVINLAELKASLEGRKRKKPNAKKIIKQIDDNGDGKLNKLEVAAKENRMISKNFDAIDANNDNEIDLKELRTFLAKNEKKRRKRRG
ncbi:MAG: EF-hand domain-containing protein [Flavobacteriaceae bacterium]